jgi:hypothetical protein
VPLVELSSWRDIVLIIWGLFISVILFLFYRKTVSVLDSTDLMVARVGNIANYVEKEVVGSISRFGAMIQGIMQGISIFGSIFNKKEDQDD